ncbi:MAG: hypothetical protein K6U09_00030 [Acidobacteriia bacterium]|nr:hypothetical protein [Terriglobia bacterium]
MWYFFGDDNSFASGREGPGRKDVFVFGGFYFKGPRLKEFENRIYEIRKKYTRHPHLPIKWNFCDRAVERLYKTYRHGHLYREVLKRTDDFRLEMLGCLNEFDAETIICAWAAPHLKHGQRASQFHGWALTNMLQRLGLEMPGHSTEKDFHILVVLDWPGQEFKKTYFDLYHRAYHFGRDEYNNRYTCGELRKKGFFSQIVCGSTVHDPFLGLADIVVGASTDFLRWCFTGQNLQRVQKFFPPVMERLRNRRGGIHRTGLIVEPKPFGDVVVRELSKFRSSLPKQRKAS